MIAHFNAFNINSIPILQNVSVDLLATSASRLVPTNHKYSIELIFKPPVADNITNLRVFDDDEQIINFLTNNEAFQEFVIDDEENQEYLQNGEVTKGNFMPKGVRTLEGMLDLHRKFRKIANIKTNSPSMQYEMINLGIEVEPKYVNLRTCCSPRERI